MAIISWEDGLSVQVAEIDAQHKKLIDMLNFLNDAMKAGKAKHILDKILDGLISYTVHHFGTEEKIMVKFSYPDYKNHLAEHQKFVQTVSDFKKEFDQGKAFLSAELLQFLCDWVTSHIAESDQKYTSFFLANGIK